MFICSSHHLKEAELFWSWTPVAVWQPLEHMCKGRRVPAYWGPLPLIGMATCCLLYQLSSQS